MILVSVCPAIPPRIVQVSRQKGIQCRFGARGIIAESHFDHGKNFVLMLRGRKRYLLNPPSACPYLAIIKEKEHPSYRHSEVDWSNESDWPEVRLCRNLCLFNPQSLYVYSHGSAFFVCVRVSFPVKNILRCVRHPPVCHTPLCALLGASRTVAPIFSLGQNCFFFSPPRYSLQLYLYTHLYTSLSARSLSAYTHFFCPVDLPCHRKNRDIFLFSSCPG